MRQESAGKADFQPAAGNRIHHGDLAGELQGVVEHRQHRAGDEPDGARDCCGGAQKYQRVGAIAAIRMEIVLDRSHVAVPKSLRQRGELQRVAPVLLG